MRARPTQEDRIRQLESDLAMARITILALVGQELHDALYPFSQFESRSALHAWFREAIEKVLSLAEVGPVERGFGSSLYAACPLCKAEAHNFYRPAT